MEFFIESIGYGFTAEEVYPCYKDVLSRFSAKIKEGCEGFKKVSITLNTAEDMLRFKTAVGHNIIIGSYCDSEDKNTITIYDDYID